MGLQARPGSLAWSCNFIFGCKKENKQTKMCGANSWLSLFLKHCDGEFRERKKRQKRSGEPVQAWSKFRITCSCVGLPFNYQEWTALSHGGFFCLFYIVCFPLLSQKWLLICHERAAYCRWEYCVICLNQTCVWMYIFHKDGLAKVDFRVLVLAYWEIVCTYCVFVVFFLISQEMALK